jgi:hypothetical protein
MATSVPLPAAFHRRRFTRSGSAIAGLATILAVWLGLSAPGISPVAPTATAEQITVSRGDQSPTETTVTVVHRHHAHR